MVDLTHAVNLTELINNQNKLLQKVTDNISIWDSKADGAEFKKLSDYVDDARSTINGNLTIKNPLEDTKVSITTSTGHSVTLNIDNKLQITKDSLALTDGTLSILGKEIKLNSEVSILFNNRIDVNLPLNIFKKTSINNLVLEGSSISLKDDKSTIKLQSSIRDNDGAYIVLTNKNYNGTPPYYDYNASSFHVITNQDNSPSFSIYKDKSSKFHSKVTIPYLEISSDEGSSLTFKTKKNNDWMINATEKSLKIQSIDNSSVNPTTGADIIAFERTPTSISYLNNIAKVHFGSTIIDGGSDYEITFDFSDTNPIIKIKGESVLGPRQTGWKSSTSSVLSRDLTTIDSSSTLSLDTLAKIVRALAYDMFSHGLIGA